MGKLIAMLTVIVAAFLMALVIPMAASGKLNKESLDKILGRTPELVEEEPDPASPLVVSLNEERARLTQWESDLTKRESLLALREGELSSTLSDVKAIQAEIAASMDELDEDQKKGMTQVASALASMEPENAAMDLESMTPERAAMLLPMIDEKVQGEILDAMTDAQHRSLIFQIMQEPKY
jgi:flagellar motility protein MotE (MotC chaperone)